MSGGEGLVSVTLQTDDGEFYVVEISPDEPVENLLALAEVHCGTESYRLHVFFNNAYLDRAKTLREQGIATDDIALLRTSPPAQPQAQPQAQAQPQGAQAAPSATDADVLRLFGAAPQTGTPQRPAPAQPAAALSPEQMVQQLFAQGAGQAAQPRAPPPDPDDPEYQRKMYEAIQQQNLQENLAQALEHTPEAFGSVHMLYVKCSVNKQPIQAFIDSGAQTTIMNEATAERCGILRLLDRRMQGVAKGVGSAKILGRIHMAMVAIGGITIPMSITILDSPDMEFLIGLDQLRRHQMCIDLTKNVLRIQEQVEVPFLAQSEIDSYRPDLDQGGEEEKEPKEAKTEPSAAVQRLMEVSGQQRQIVENALEACQGNEDAAAAMLLEGVN